MMRFIIYKGKEEKVTLDEKISYLNNFIALQTARYQIKK
jgi:LytS/YehU family sensor histidine kinase